MKKSMDKILSSDKSSSKCDLLYSHKRYFINNLDSYNGEYYLREVSKVLLRNALPSMKQVSQTVMGEDMEPATPPPPELPYEIIGMSNDAGVFVS